MAVKVARTTAAASAAAAAAALSIASGLYLLHRRRSAAAAKSRRAALVDLPSRASAAARKNGSVAYVRVRTSDLARAAKFYTDLGLVKHASASEADGGGSGGGSGSNTRSSSENKYVVLQSPSPHPGQPILLLEHDPSRKVRTADASAAGYARMCLLVQDVPAKVTQMKKLGGYQPIAPAATDRPGSCDANGRNPNAPVTIVAYRDYDGNVVELVSLTGMARAAMGILSAVGMIRFPAWVHVNINATSFDTSYDAYRQLGFVTDVDYGRVVNKLYRALGIPDPGIAKQVSLIKLPGTNFSVDLIEWEDPKTTTAAASGGSISLGTALDMAITVPDVAQTVDELVLGGSAAAATDASKQNENGWSLASAPRIVDLPSPLGRAVHASVSDPDGVEISLLSFGSNLFDDDDRTVKAVGGRASIRPSADRVVLCTGCDSGFGRSAVCQLAGLGFSVVAACYTAAGSKFLAGVARTVIADLTTERGMKDVVDATTEACRERSLWGIVNNAGMCHPGNVEWTKPDAYKRVMALNFHAPVRIIHDLLPLVKKSRGRIVNVTSVCGIVSSPSNSTYCCSKFALEALSDSLRVEMMPFGVDVVVLEPTTMRTPLGLGWSDQWRKNYDEADPLRKSQHPAEWANKFHDKISNDLVAAGEDPFITVREIANALVLPVQKARVLCGEGAKGYRILAMMPDKWRDAILKDPIGGLGADGDESPLC